MSTRQEFLDEVEVFLLDTGMREGTFGERALGDRAFVNSMRRGRVPMVDTVDKVRRFMANERTRLKRRSRRKKKARRVEGVLVPA